MCDVRSQLAYAMNFENMIASSKNNLKCQSICVFHVEIILSVGGNVFQHKLR